MSADNQPVQINTNLRLAAWGLTLTVITLAVIAWGQGLRWHLSNLTTLNIFPIFGLIAFSTMWSQYMVNGLKAYLKIDSELLYQYFKITGFIVLAAILLHPGLLVWQLWRDGFGLPPGSYLHYVAPGLRYVALIGTTCFLIFMAYELRYKFGNRKWWHYMNYAVDAAILGIFYHGLKLGSQLQSGWFQKLWFFYGATLITVILYSYSEKFRERRKTVRHSLQT